MQRLPWQISFILLLSIGLNGCKSPGPKGPFCTTSIALSADVCVDIESGATLANVPIDQTDKWVHLPPATWQSIQDYIDYLRSKSSRGLKIYPEELEMLSNQMLNLRQDTLHK